MPSARIAETEEAAQAELAVYREGADIEAISNISSYFSNVQRTNARDRVEKMKNDISYTGRIVAGPPSKVADAIEDLVVDGQLDSIQVLFPDYIKGLTLFGDQVMPLLRARGLIN